MMPHEMVWLSVSADRPRLEVDIDDVPVARLGNGAARSMPINEFLRPGTNRIRVRLEDRPPAAPYLPAAGRLTVTVTHTRWEGERELSRQTLLAAERAYAAADVRAGGTLLEDAFASPLPPPGPTRALTPLGPEAHAPVLARLAEVAGWWRNGDADAFLAWTDDYVRDYVHAYPIERFEEYRADLRATFERYAGGRVSFDPAGVMLRRCGGGRLFDARAGDRGPAIRIKRDDGDRYLFWTTLGVADGAVVFVR